MDRIATAQARAGELVCVEGVVRSTGEAPLRSSVSQRECVCYEAHGGLLTGGDDSEEGQPFFIEDDSGRALITMDRFELQLGELAAGAALDVLQADIHAVSGRLSDLKVEVRSCGPSKVRALQREITHMKGLATLLCAVRAHAKGNLHVGKDRADQERFIRENTAKYSSEQAQRRLSWAYLERYDTILRDGDRVRVIGMAAHERAPDGAALGYRDFAKRLVLRAPANGSLQIRGAGAESASQTLQVKESEHRAERKALARGEAERSSLGWFLLALVLVGVAISQCL